MPLVAENVVRISLKHIWSDTIPVVNTLDMFVSDPTGPASREAAVNVMLPDVRDNWQDHIVSFGPDNLKFLGLDWVDLDSPDGRTGTLLPNTSKATAGAGTTPRLPPSVCFLVTKIAGGTRGTRNGRWYFPGVGEADVDEDGKLGSGAITGWQAKLDAFYSGVEDDVPGGVSQHPTVVQTLTRDDKGNPLTGQSRRITGFRMESLVAHQRRRSLRR